ALLLQTTQLHAVEWLKATGGKQGPDGKYFYSQEEKDYVELPSTMFGGDLFILNVSGESMINAGIYDGDQIIVRKQSTASNGQKVIALIDDSATVKTFYKENGHIRLQPENDTMEPIIVPDCTILGVVVGLIRKY
ncbi:MAG: repressor LexA, partial [Clostridia bacterium]|nr:repressor LexA [Clostridia bacterium]